MSKVLTIVGGGLAGLTLGIGLRQRDVPVILREARRYPHHRVCGEFISGNGLQSLLRLGLRGHLKGAGAIAGTTAAFFSQKSGTPSRKLPTEALCISRHVLDQVLAKEFQRLGGELREGERATDEEYPQGAVRATGRRPQSVENGARWFGLKVHARNVALASDLEMHVAPNGYVGLCRIGNDLVNVCGLFRRASNANESGTPGRELLRGNMGSILHERLAGAQFDENTFCAVAGLALQPRAAVERAEVCVGDAVTMIPPVTGNGMSMAFESAELAIEPLATWSRGEIPWSEVRRDVAQKCDAAFARRLKWARWLQALIFSSMGQGPLVFMAGRSGIFLRWWFARTR